MILTLRGRGEDTKRLHRITRTEGGYSKRLHWIPRGWEINLVQPWHRQSIKENPDFIDENQFVVLKIKQKIYLLKENKHKLCAEVA